MMMSGSLYKEIGGMATGQEGVAMVRVWHQGWIFGVIKVYIVTFPPQEITIEEEHCEHWGGFWSV